MSIQYAHAKKGYRFAPTEDGAKEGRINNLWPRISGALSQYDKNYPTNSYLYCVPKAWITKGWIKEIKDDDNIR